MKSNNSNSTATVAAKKPSDKQSENVFMTSVKKSENQKSKESLTAN